MKITKDARQLARQLFRISLTDGLVDRGKVMGAIQTVIEKKPRNYLAALDVYKKLLRFELERRHAIIESASELGSVTTTKILSNLQSKYGEDLTADFKVNPELIGGLRIRIGDDVWDGSIRSRLARLQEQF